MPYFSFSLNDNFKRQIFENTFINLDNINSETVYYSKSTQLWKNINQKKNKHYIKNIDYEKRIKVKKIGNKILFCLPPSIGLGDAVEYALSIKAIAESNTNLIIGIAFVGRYKKIFSEFFDLKFIYKDLISKKTLNEFNTIFHVSIEIKGLNIQKYDRKDIEKLITKYFNVEKYRNIKNIKFQKIEKLSFFPISQSPIRTMSSQLINQLIANFKNKYDIEIILDRFSNISEHISNKIIDKDVKKIFPKNLSELLLVIENMCFGVFMDSGPLHVAKILNKKGILITSSVGKNILLKDFKSIQSINNNYESFYCKSPCGLVNVFNYNNKIGCYDSLAIQKKTILKLKKLQILQRGSLKINYVNLVSNPVNCLQQINKKEVVTKIQQCLFI